MALTVTAPARVPVRDIERARKAWPVQTEGLSNGRILRFALLVALGVSPDDAVAETTDPRSRAILP